MERKKELELLGNLLGDLYLYFRCYSWEAKTIHDAIKIVFNERLKEDKKDNECLQSVR